MATKTKAVETNEIEETATNRLDPKMMSDNLTFVVEEKKKESDEPTVRIYLPRIEDDGSVAVDQYEHVTIANENGEPERWRVHRGEWVDIPVHVYIVMKEKYPDL